MLEPQFADVGRHGQAVALEDPVKRGARTAYAGGDFGGMQVGFVEVALDVALRRQQESLVAIVVGGA